MQIDFTALPVAPMLAAGGVPAGEVAPVIKNKTTQSLNQASALRLKNGLAES